MSCGGGGGTHSFIVCCRYNSSVLTTTMIQQQQQQQYTYTNVLDLYVNTMMAIIFANHIHKYSYFCKNYASCLSVTVTDVVERFIRMREQEIVKLAFTALLCVLLTTRIPYEAYFTAAKKNLSVCLLKARFFCCYPYVCVCGIGVIVRR